MRAFPQIKYIEKMEFCEYLEYSEEGMTLLDYFAGQVVAGAEAAGEDDTLSEMVAEYAYKRAAAMLRERQNWSHETGERKG